MAHMINSNCCSSLTCLYVCSRIGSMLEQVRNLVVIKISVITISVALFILMLKINFHVCKNSSAPSINAALWHYLGTYNLDFSEGSDTHWNLVCAASISKSEALEIRNHLNFKIYSVKSRKLLHTSCDHN